MVCVRASKPGQTSGSQRKHVNKLFFTFNPLSPMRYHFKKSYFSKLLESTHLSTICTEYGSTNIKSFYLFICLIPKNGFNTVQKSVILRSAPFAKKTPVSYLFTVTIKKYIKE